MLSANLSANTFCKTSRWNILKRRLPPTSRRWRCRRYAGGIRLQRRILPVSERERKRNPPKKRYLMPQKWWTENKEKRLNGEKKKGTCCCRRLTARSASKRCNRIQKSSTLTRLRLTLSLVVTPNRLEIDVVPRNLDMWLSKRDISRSLEIDTTKTKAEK